MLAIASLTQGGADLCMELKKAFPKAVCFGKYGEAKGIIPIDKPFKDWLKEEFDHYSQWIFVMATGIVVRSVSSLLVHKSQDPAVVVMDERGEFAISLISGHLGGANQLARRVAGAISATPVITTSSDVQGLLAVDELADELDAALFHYDAALLVTADLVNGKTVGLWAETPISLPKGYEGYWGEAGWQCMEEDLLTKKLASFVCLSDRTISSVFSYVQIYPQELVLGIGCKKNTAAEVIRAGIQEMVEEEGYSIHAVGSLASAWIKFEEMGIRRVASDLKIRFSVYDRKTIRTVSHRFEGSAFVETTIGVPCVSEPCGFLASDGGECLAPVVKKNGMALSLWKKGEGTR